MSGKVKNRLRPWACAITALTLLGAAAVSVVAPASAQSGSRLCGNHWYGWGRDAQGNVATFSYGRIMEVRKNNIAGIVGWAAVDCAAVVNKTDHLDVATDVPEWAGLTISWSARRSIEFETCERVGKDLALGTLGADPCLNMNKANDVSEVLDQTSHVYHALTPGIVDLWLGKVKCVDQPHDLPSPDLLRPQYCDQ